jgi:hypothetical protein
VLSAAGLLVLAVSIGLERRDRRRAAGPVEQPQAA